MNRPKVYLDTSVISHLIAEETPEKMQDTLLFWEELRKQKYVVMISDITVAEISKCLEPKRTRLFEYQNELEFSIFDETEETLDLAEKYLLHGVLNPKSRDDCRHISIATILECKYIASWNFKHFVNVKTIEKVQAINKLFGYNEINILPPSMFLQGDQNDE